MSTTRYSHTNDPVQTDGRDISPSSGLLTGEAASQIASGSLSHDLANGASTWTALPEPVSYDPTYYDRPVLQQSVWTWAIPTYYFVGGLSGAALVLASALQLRNKEASRDAIRSCHLIAFGGTSLSAALLIYDLGRPMRFLNMLRVFRPTSAMNVGAWILSFAGATAAASVLLRSTICGRPIGILAGVFGLGLSTYTGVLAANTAVPVWQNSRRVLPILFGASATASLGSVFDLFTDNPTTRIFGTAGRIGELAGSIAMEREAAQVEYVARPLKSGWSGFLWRSASALTAGSLVCSIAGRRHRAMRLAAGLLGATGSLALRFAVEAAGNQSARDPRATFRNQRQWKG